MNVKLIAHTALSDEFFRNIEIRGVDVVDTHNERAAVQCINKECTYREFNGGDDYRDYYFCKAVGIEVGDGSGMCLVDVYDKEDED